MVCSKYAPSQRGRLARASLGFGISSDVQESYYDVVGSDNRALVIGPNPADSFAVDPDARTYPGRKKQAKADAKKRAARKKKADARRREQAERDAGGATVEASSSDAPA